jgi:hypothetical protein
MLTECCGRRLCDTEGTYEMASYERDGQCARNHRYNTICGYHHNEGHDGDWQSCKTCEGDFHPYDYAVKATSMKVACTQRKYNFEDNVREDLFPQSMSFPQCDVCRGPVDTTEETTRTLRLDLGATPSHPRSPSNTAHPSPSLTLLPVIPPLPLPPLCPSVCGGCMASHHCASSTGVGLGESTRPRTANSHEKGMKEA